MKYHLLNEAIGLLEILLHKQSDTSGCVKDGLVESIRNLKQFSRENVSDTELSAMILEELGRLFLLLPEIQEQIEDLARLQYL